MAGELQGGTWAERLFSFIQRYPGVHLREIRRRLQIPIGTLDYHLYRLGRQGLISVRFQGGYKCCFPAISDATSTPIPEPQQALLSLLRQPLPRAVLLRLYLEGPSTPAQLSEAVDTTGPNLSYFLKKLEAAGVLTRDGVGASRSVRLNDPRGVHEVLLRFPPLPETAVDRFLRFWTELHP